MKSFITFLFLMLISNIKAEDVSKYSVKNFIRYLKANSYYQPIENMKIISDDVAIEFCIGLCSNKHCTTVVKSYMQKPMVIVNFKTDAQKFDDIVKEYKNKFLKKLTKAQLGKLIKKIKAKL